MSSLTPGAVARFRDREWVLLPSNDPDIIQLRPIAGVTEEAIEVKRSLSQRLGSSLPAERIEPAAFPMPDTKTIADAVSTWLLWDAARLVLREGASPLRSLGRISIRPRIYQFVPLLMALRLDPVRLLIADDVGVGKTIEAGLIARELWDRSEIQRIAVLCPPYLCDQWQRELTDKFNLPAVIIRSSTLSQLEREMPSGSQTLYRHYPIHIVSMDWVKSDRNRPLFLQECAEFVIVDEAHNAVPAGAQAQQQRYELIAALARNPNRHLILLTATPHSGIPEAFQKLLGLLNPDFESWNFTAMNESQRDLLARHFVQRTRADIEKDWETNSCFPKRSLLENHYRLSPEGHKLYHTTLALCRELVRGATLENQNQRARYWGALALLRSVMSSPEAAIQAVRNRGVLAISDEEPLGDQALLENNELMDPTLLEATDEMPVSLIESAERTLSEQERRHFQAIAQIAKKMRFTPEDTKLSDCLRMTQELLKEGFNPIVWCRFVATAEYVAQAMAAFEDAQVTCVTGHLADEERRAKIAEIDPGKPRVLVATDCLSEGVNLQELFDAAIHYDLPWNPNKLEQREGRIDRYGQSRPEVKTYRYYSPDNPVDGTVIKVLLTKAQEIRQTLGTYVPVPEESRSLQEALLNAIFMRPLSQSGAQMHLDLDLPAIVQLTKQMDQNAEREKATRTRFAQRTLKPDDVQRELEAADKVLGDPELVRRFILEASQRLGFHLRESNQTPKAFKIIEEDADRMPRLVSESIQSAKLQSRLVSFDSPTPQGAVFMGRNHPLTQAVAQHLFESAIAGDPESPASRCGAIATRAVQEPTALYLIRQRYTLQIPNHGDVLAEETRLFGVSQNSLQPLEPEHTNKLFHEASPAANLSREQKEESVQKALEAWIYGSHPDPNLRQAWQQQLQLRVAELERSHKQIRQSLKMKIDSLQIRPLEPPDLIGVLVLTPV